MVLGLFKRKVRVVKVKRKAKPKKRVKIVKSKKRVTRAKIKRAPVKKVKLPQVVGKITHYFPHVKAGVILVTKGKISLGDTLQIKGHTTDFKQKVKSIEINNVPIKEGKPGQEIGFLAKSRVRHNDVVYKL